VNTRAPVRAGGLPLSAVSRNPVGHCPRWRADMAHGGGSGGAADDAIDLCDSDDDDGGGGGAATPSAAAAAPPSAAAARPSSHAPPPPDPPPHADAPPAGHAWGVGPFARGQEVVYWNRAAGAAVRARIVSVDLAEVPPTYEVQLCGGGGACRHTEASRLAALPKAGAAAASTAAAAAAGAAAAPEAAAAAAPAAGGSSLMAELAAARHARRGRPGA
jgi:hypothetical protein